MRSSKLRDELVGPTIGAELRGKALVALGVALAAQMAYLAVRFRWTFGAAAVLGMLHDVLIVVGIFAWLNKPVDGVFLAAILTIVGLSVNDTVVVFDRIRERQRAHPDDPLETVANTAVLQTIPRTINTGLGAMAILAVLVAGGGTPWPTSRWPFCSAWSWAPCPRCSPPPPCSWRSADAGHHPAVNRAAGKGSADRTAGLRRTPTRTFHPAGSPDASKIRGSPDTHPGTMTYPTGERR